MRHPGLPHPTRRALALAGAAPAIAIALMIIDLDLWFVALGYLCALVFALVYDSRTGFIARHLLVDIEPPRVLHVGEEGGMTLRFRTNGRGAHRSIETVVDVEEKIMSPAPGTVRLARDGSGVLAVRLDPIRRGTTRIEAVWCRWAGPLGLTWRICRVDVGAEFPVVPNLPAVRRVALILDRRGSRVGSKPQLSRGAGSEFEALREFVSGQDRRGIDWKHSARHRKLITREYRTEQNHSVIVAIDCGHVMREPIAGLAKIDHAINSALIVSYQALAEGDRVGVYGFDAQPQVYQAPVAGKRSFPLIQSALSSLDYSVHETNFTLGMIRLMGELRQSSIIIVFTDFLESTSAQLMVESVSNMSRRHLVLFAALSDPELEETSAGQPKSQGDVIAAVVASEMNRDRQEVLERLRRSKVDAFDVVPRELDAEVLSRFISIRERATLSGGR